MFLRTPLVKMHVGYVDSEWAGELLGLSGLQLPRGPSLNTDRKEILTMKKHSLETHYPIQQEGLLLAGLGQRPKLGTFSDSPPYLVTPSKLSPSEIESLKQEAKSDDLRMVEILAKQAKTQAV
jgi:hypothetical protein